MQELDDLRAWLLGAMRREIADKYPGVIDSFRSAQPGTLEDLAERVSDLPFEPLEPWNSLIALLWSLRYQLDALDFVASSLERAQDGRTLLFFNDIGPVVGYSCLEAFEKLFKRLSRGKSPLLREEAVNAIREYLAQIGGLPDLKVLRDHGAHGPQLGVGRDGWIEAGKRQRFWEVAALMGDDGSYFDGVYSAAIFMFSEERFQIVNESFRPFVDRVNSTIQDMSRLLLAGLVTPAL